jgi:pimeloyl-ACP methyl ester carboxylesterase
MLIFSLSFMNAELSWEQRIGNQREWVWRGWQVRYTYLRAAEYNPDAPPLIFLHGFGASIEHWRYNLPVMSQNYTVYALDLLGFGASRKANVDYSIELWVELVHDFWLIFINTPVILIGNSIGSLVCLTAADNYPEMVKGLVMLSLPDVSVRQDILPRSIRPLVTAIENLVASPFLIKNLIKILRTPPVIRRWAKLAYENEAAVDDELVAILSAPAYDLDADKTLYALSQSIRKSNFAKPVDEMLPRIQISMLLIWGLKDKMVPSILAPKFAQLNARLKSIELENIGHCPHDECPEIFNSILLDWLAKSI